MDMGIELVTAGLSIRYYISLFIGTLVVIVIVGIIVGSLGEDYDDKR